MTARPEGVDPIAGSAAHETFRGTTAARARRRAANWRRAVQFLKSADGELSAHVTVQMDVGAAGLGKHAPSCGGGGGCRVLAGWLAGRSGYAVSGGCFGSADLDLAVPPPSRGLAPEKQRHLH